MQEILVLGLLLIKAMNCLLLLSISSLSSSMLDSKLAVPFFSSLSALIIFGLGNWHQKRKELNKKKKEDARILKHFSNFVKDVIKWANAQLINNNNLIKSLKESPVEIHPLGFETTDFEMRLTKMDDIIVLNIFDEKFNNISQFNDIYARIIFLNNIRIEIKEIMKSYQKRMNELTDKYAYDVLEKYKKRYLIIVTNLECNNKKDTKIYKKLYSLYGEYNKKPSIKNAHENFVLPILELIETNTFSEYSELLNDLREDADSCKHLYLRIENESINLESDINNCNIKLEESIKVLKENSKDLLKLIPNENNQ